MDLGSFEATSRKSLLATIHEHIADQRFANCRDDRDRRQARFLPQHPGGVDEVLPKRVHS